jgi:vacuolar-type H+-ATPase subunit H
MSNPQYPIVKPPSSPAPAPHGEDAEAIRLRQNISQTRAELQGTIGELHGKLNPTVLKEQALEQLHEVKATLRTDFQEAKVALEAELKSTLTAEVTAVITQAKSEAKAAIAEAKEDVKAGITEATTALRAATIGKVETMMQDAQETVTETGNTVFESVKQNPIPALLAGVGLTWLFMNARTTSSVRRQRMSSQDRYRQYGQPQYGQPQYGQPQYGQPQVGQGQYNQGQYGQGQHNQGQFGHGEYAQHRHDGGSTHLTAAQTATNALHGVTDKVSGAAHSVQRSVVDAAHTVERSVGSVVDKAGNFAQQAQSTIGQAGRDAGQSITRFAHGASDSVTQAAHDAQMQARRVERQAETYYLDNPLIVGGAVLALGTLVGLAIPITAQEDRWMGKASDEVTGKARMLAQQGLQQAEGAAKQAAGEAAKALNPATNNGNKSVSTGRGSAQGSPS